MVMNGDTSNYPPLSSNMASLESHELNRGCSQPLRYKAGKLDKYNR